ncbi:MULTISPECIES: CinA family protein [unclassified Leisingera]|uniref:CinA family protein n=1 Tax=unclassified Leisingera TaxID=2614906 RepID=UPI00057F6E34|nr:MULTISPECIES: CinA family protein [unclassified Leisingera]KIC27324.1 damage-inducible protein CinA [Leisingera sp. ANG-M6]KIC33711.1 damage-inducible protein CinA [Leisingera sp. ANG-S5]
MDADELIRRATAAGITIATAESCTGGMIAAALTDIPGSSAVVDRGFVTYSNAAKMQMLGVKAETLDAVGAVSEEVAAEMAAGAVRNAGVTLAVSVTGIAGPGGSEFKPEGRVCFGLARAGQTATTEIVEFGAIGRANVRAATRDHALELLAQAVSQIERETGS